jgi:uncharacterized protein
MKRLLSAIVVLACVGVSFGPVVLSSAAHAQEITAPQTGLRKERLTIATPRGQRAFVVEMADTPRTREIGMMWRTSVPRLTSRHLNMQGSGWRTRWSRWI